MRLFASGEGGYAEEGDEEEEGMAVVGLTDRRKYNGFVPLMDEGDPLKTAVMTVFSGLQVRTCFKNKGSTTNVYCFSFTLCAVSFCVKCSCFSFNLCCFFVLVSVRWKY